MDGNLDEAPMADVSLGLAIPVIDLAHPRAALVAQIARACREWGFFQIVGHGVDPALMAAADAEARAFFAAPKAEKRALLRDKDNPWGFYDRELTKNTRDKKEVFDIGPDAAGIETPDAVFAGATRWPAWRAPFAPTLRAYFAACEGVSGALVDLIGEGLDAREVLIEACKPAHTSFLRLNYYPVADPLRGEAGDEAGLGVHHHTDAGFLTVLKQDEVSGLQVYRDGFWHSVEPLDGAFVINIGDMVQVWSNDLYPAPIHRVLAMQRADRISLPFFHNPAYRAVVEPLASQIRADRPARYRPILWGDFRRARADGDFADYGAEIQIRDYRI